MSSVSAHRASDPIEPLAPSERAFVDNWGSLAEAFGMKRDQGRVHALIYIALAPLDDAAIARRLELSDVDARRHLSELSDWGVIARDRDGSGYTTDPDPWAWFLQILAERHHREFGPVLQAMRRTLSSLDARANTPSEREFYKRAERFTTFVEDLSRLIELFLRLGSKPMAAVLKTLAKIAPRA